MEENKKGRSMEPMGESYEINFAKEEEIDNKEKIEYDNLAFEDDPEGGDYEQAYRKSDSVVGKANENMEYMEAEGFLLDKGHRFTSKEKMDRLMKRYEKLSQKQRKAIQEKLKEVSDGPIDDAFEEYLREYLGESAEEMDRGIDEHEVIAKASEDTGAAEKIYRAKDVFQNEANVENPNMKYMEEEGFLTDKKK